MFKKEIEIYDAICIVILMEHCINTGLYDKPYSCLMSRELYSQAKQETLEKLGLDREFFSGEDKDPYDIAGYEDDDGYDKDHYGKGNARNKGKRNPLNMMGEDTMLMMQDQTDLMTNTCAAGVEKSMAVATDVPTHLSNVHGQSAIDVTHLEATVVIVDSQPSDEKQEDEQQEEAVNGVIDTLEYGSSIAMSEHS